MADNKTELQELKKHICETLFPELKKLEPKYRLYQEVKLEMVLVALDKEGVLDSGFIKKTNVDRIIFLINQDAEDIEWEFMKPLHEQSAETIHKLNTLLLIN